MSDPRTRLARAEWDYVSATGLAGMNAADWERLERQRPHYYAERQARSVLRMLEQAADDPSFGYEINHYRHSLQAATLVRAAGRDDEAVAVALLHDIGFAACPLTHGDFAAALLGPYISETQRWMLEHHQEFQNPYVPHLSAEERGVRERWRGHPAFAWTVEFVDRFDQASMDASFQELPLAAFEACVVALFARAPNLKRP